MTDGKSKWCTLCAGGKVLSSEKDGEGACTNSLLIENCQMADPSERTNPNKCSKCMSGYFLSKDESRCLYGTKGDYPSCDNPEIWDGGKICLGCEGHYLDEGYQACSTDTNIPDNCKYGDTESSKMCLECKNGFLPTKNR